MERRGLIRGRFVLAALAAAFAVLALAPAGAMAADPEPGCEQTGGGDPDTTVSEWTCYSQPTTVAGYEVKRGFLNVPKPEVNGSIVQMDVDVADANGAIPIDRLMLHHIVFFNGGANDPLCGGGERFFGAGEERLKMSFPDGYGYQIKDSDSWVSTYMYMNHKPTTDKGWIKYSMTIDPDPAIAKARAYWMDVGNCAADPIYNVPGIDPPQVPNCSKLKKAAKRKGTKGAKRKFSRCAKKAKSIRAALPTEASHVESKTVTSKHNGFIVTGAGHVHGGAKELSLHKPTCQGDPEVAKSVPTWGNPDHPFYNVKPILHEPGPVGMSAFRAPPAGSPGNPGIPIANGQQLRLDSVYDNLQPHTRVMGIYVVYVVPKNQLPDSPAIEECAGAPAGTEVGPGTNVPGRPGPVTFKVPLTGLDSNLNAVEIDGPPGQFKTLGNGATVTVGDRYFSEPNVRVTPGTTLNYQFIGGELHNLTLANGPLGIGSPDAFGGQTYSQRFDRPGTYRFFCGLHPVQMTERVVVEKPKPKKKKKSKRKR